MIDVVVKLDSAGHVAGVRPGPVSDGWVNVPDDVARDPFAHRLCPERGWVVKTPDEHAEFQRRHEPKVAERPDDASLRQLRRRLATGHVSQGERDELLCLLIDRVLGD